MQIFFADSLKFFVSLYGHKLPVLAMDISSDGALIASGSADKNLKIWGMDFGDCHKSLFAHGDRYNNLGLWSEVSSLLCFLELRFYWAVKVFDSIA